ncbi:capsular polysaccharide export protein, LipB/KpsS family [Mangrovimonas xylaniphaga]|uniref:capsular polysaccharide export protein, LipB/KpsS family n=1 Tax=Mangrovimonas xylaniphaga TaxID=1645915 RepID=UPI0006B4D65D|nr:hypothetical protein [Mangrovimonas xylaniphaga]
MKSYVLIYVYNGVSDEELNFWEAVHKVLLARGVELYMLLQIRPKRPVTFSFNTFTERLDDVEFPKSLRRHVKDIDFTAYLEREATWYGVSEKDRLKAAQYQYIKYKALINELNPCLVVLGNGQHAGELILKKVVKDKGTPLMYIERGSLPNSWHLDAYGMTAGTEIARKRLEDLPLDGIQSYLKYRSYYLNRRETWWPQPELNNAVSIREKFQIAEDEKLILFANQLDNDTSNFLYNPFFETNAKAFEWFCKRLKQEGHKCFVLAKKHPHYRGDEFVFAQILEHTGQRGAWVEDIPLFECMNESDLVCAVNSTMLFEAMIYEKPVLQMGDSILNEKALVYQLKGYDDTIVDDWYKAKGFDAMLESYKAFMSCLIDTELAFYFKGVEAMGLNYVDFFVAKLLNSVDGERKGDYPSAYDKLNSYKRPLSMAQRVKKKTKKLLSKINVLNK